MADGSPGTFGPPDAAPAAAGADNDIMSQFMQMIMGGGGLAGAPQGNFGGGNQMLPIAPDALGMGMGGDPLGLGNMLTGGGIGLNPAQAAGLRLQRNNKMNALRQNMANAHRAIGPAGGTDYSRHVQNVDDEMLALQEQKVQSNIQNALAMDREALAWAQFNRSQDLDFWNQLYKTMASIGTFGGGQQGGGSTFSPPQES